MSTNDLDCPVCGSGGFGDCVCPPRSAWVCDGCMRRVHRNEIADYADGEHVLCRGCLDRNRAGR